MADTFINVYPHRGFMTSTFRFALEPVLTLRERVRDQRFAALAERHASWRAAQDRLAALRGDLRRQIRALSQSRTSRPEQLRFRYAQIDYLDAAIAVQEAAVAAARAGCDAARSDFAEAAKEHKAMELLKERQFAEHELGAKRRERREMEETGVRRYAGLQSQRRAGQR